MIEQVLTPTKIIQTERLAAEQLDRMLFYYGVGSGSVAVVTDNRPFPLRDEMIERLKNLRGIVVLDRVFPDPKVSDIMAMAGELADRNVRAVVGIGGGSTLDSAKAVAAVLDNGGDLDAYLGPGPEKRIAKRDIKLILVPTTVGTGSEMTKFGVYTARTGRKYTLNHPLLQADAAVLATEYVLDLPAPILAATAFDALSHALETLWNRHASPVSDRVATEAAVHILRWMEPAYDGSPGARREMLAGACMAGIAFNMTGTAAVHALSFILSEEWHIPHGTACAFTLEEVMEINLMEPSVATKLTDIARKLFGGEAAENPVGRLTERITELKRKFLLPSTFRELGVDAPEERLVTLFEKAMEDPKMDNNIVPFDRSIIHRLIREKCR